MFKIPQETTKQLETLNASPRFAHQAGTNKVKCEIIEKTTGKKWAEATAGSEEKSLEEAMKGLKPGDKPMTPAEAMSKVKRYQDKFGDIDDLEENEPKRQEQAEPQPNASVESVDTEDDTADENDLIAMAEERNIRVDRRKSNWRADLRRKIEQHDRQLQTSS